MNLDQVKIAHQTWLSQEVTKAVMEGINKHREKFMEFISKNASSKDTTAEQIRYQANGVKTCDAILKIITDLDILISLLDNSSKTHENPSK